MCSVPCPKLYRLCSDDCEFKQLFLSSHLCRRAPWPSYVTWWNNFSPISSLPFKMSSKRWQVNWEELPALLPMPGLQWHLAMPGIHGPALAALHSPVPWLSVCIFCQKGEYRTLCQDGENFNTIPLLCNMIVKPSVIQHNTSIYKMGIVVTIIMVANMYWTLRIF